MLVELLEGNTSTRTTTEHYMWDGGSIAENIFTLTKQAMVDDNDAD